MATYDVLRTALALVSGADPQSVRSERFRPESLSAAERTRLDDQVRATTNWSLGDGENVVGLGIAEKRVAAGSTADLCLAVYVREKRPEGALSREQRVPAALELTGVPEAVPTDVREIGAIRLEALAGRVRPVLGGYSVGRAEQKGMGTLGCLVRKRSQGAGPYLLSNSHVLADSGLGRPGDPIVQPGGEDARAAPETVARLDSWQPFNFDQDVVNRIDAALAEPLTPADFDPRIYEIGLPKGVRAATRGAMVQKSGRTSEHTWGRVQDVDFVATLQYPRPGGGHGAVRFGQLILCSRFTEPGDSGSLVLDAEGYAVGLHFCGTPTVSISCAIQHVLDELDVELVV